MWRLCWPWSTGLAVLAFLRASTVASNRQHADPIQARLDETPADVAEPCLSVSDDVVLRSVSAVRLELRLPDCGG
jgi:hypothetical protein